jgi:hypothetical protein
LNGVKLYAGISCIVVDNWVSFAGFGVDVLRNVSGIGMATLTEGVTLHVGEEESAAWAVGGVVGEAGWRINSVGGRIEFDTADHLTQGTGGSDIVLAVP